MEHEEPGAENKSIQTLARTRSLNCKSNLRADLRCIIKEIRKHTGADGVWKLQTEAIPSRDRKFVDLRMR